MQFNPQIGYIHSVSCHILVTVTLIIIIYLLNDMCHIASPQQTLPAFFQLVLFLAAATASPQDLSPADAIFLVINPGLGCGSCLRPPS